MYERCFSAKGSREDKKNRIFLTTIHRNGGCK